MFNFMDIEANKFYDSAHRLYDAAIITLCYTQHALQPYIDSKINHIKHFIISIKKYKNPIRSTVFNYNKLVTELDIENSIPDS